jgi:hypothetical protein
MMTRHRAPDRQTGFGFAEIMRRADHTRFPDWYARTSRLAAKQAAD